MAEMEVDATTPGPRELQHWDLYKELIADGTVSVISSNLSYVSEDGSESRIGEEYMIFERNGVRVALFALMGGNQYSSAKIPEGVEVLFADPFETAEALVPKLREQAEVVVLLSQMSTADTDRVVQEVAGIDAALYGNLAPWVDRCTEIGSTVANKTGTRGQYMGHLVLIVDPEGEIIEFGSKNSKMDEAHPEKEELAIQVAELEEENKKILDERRKERTSSTTSSE